MKHRESGWGYAEREKGQGYAERGGGVMLREGYIC